MAQVRHLSHYLSRNFSVVSCFLTKASLYYKGHWRPNKAQQHAVLYTVGIRKPVHRLGSTWEAELGGITVNSRPFWSTESQDSRAVTQKTSVSEVGGEEERKSDHTGKKDSPVLVCHLKTLCNSSQLVDLDSFEGRTTLPEGSPKTT